MHIAIVALGPSSLDYIKMAEAGGGRSNVFDEVWTVNSYGDVLQADRIFHMDDVKVQETRENIKVQGMLKWMKTHPGPIYTSREYPDYPGLKEFPLEKVLNVVGTDYFNSTVAYALAYAIYLDVKKITFFGIDFTWPDVHAAEQGRACVEYWIGRAMQRGISITVAPSSTLMDANIGRPLYGYDTLEVDIQYEDGKATVNFTEKPPPSGEEMEKRYSHVRPPGD